MNDVQSPDRLRILFIIADRFGCGFYRMMVPANEIKKQDLADVVVNDKWDWKEVEWANIIVIQRMTDIQAYEGIDQAHSMGKKIVFEIDDYVNAISPENPSFGFWNPLGPNYGRFLKIMKMCDAVQVTTERLRNEYVLWNDNVGVLPNCLDRTLWEAPPWTASEWDKYYKRKNDGIIRILYAGAGCYDDKTEILTENGFKLFKDLLKGERVATLNPANDTLEYHAPTRYIGQHYKGKMFNVDTRQLNFCVTPNHNMYAAKQPCDSKKDSLKYNLVRAEHICGRSFFVKRNAVWAGEDADYFVLPATSYRRSAFVGGYKGKYGHKVIDVGCDEKRIIMDDWLKFFGFWLAEGWTSKSSFEQGGERYNLMQVGIAQFKDNEYLEEMRNLLLKYGFHARYTKDKKQLRVCNKQLWEYLRQFGGATEKFIPKEIRNLPPDKLRLLLNYFVRGDGHIDHGGRMRAWTSSRRLADNLSEIALKIGWGTSIRNRGKMSHITRDGRKIAGKHDNFQINFLQVGKKSYLRPYVSSKHHKWVDYDGVIYCVEVQNHVIFTRRGGKTMWCGNSHYRDLQLIEGVITEICRKYPNVHFCMMGYHGESRVGKNLFQEVTPVESYCPHCKEPGQLEKIEGVQLAKYPGALKMCAGDIGIAPLIETGFNQGKSNLKILEYAALGIPVVATNMKPYSPAVKDGFTGFLASTGKEWYNDLELLIKDEELRRRFGKNNYRWYRENTIDRHIHKWIDFYQRIVSFRSKW